MSRHPAFDFTRNLLDDGDLRLRMARAGYYSGMPITVLPYGAPWSDADGDADRMAIDYPILAVRQNPGADHGWELHVRRGPEDGTEIGLVTVAVL